MLSITESKFESCITNTEVDFNGHGIIRKTETKMEEVLHGLLETLCVLIPKIFFQILWNMFFQNSCARS